MDKETAKYIIDYFFNLLPKNELLTAHWFLSKKTLPPILQVKGFVDPAFLDLFENYDTFEEALANRIMMQYADKVFLNKCPKCQKLARTPYAKQCRHCGHNWREAETK